MFAINPSTRIQTVNADTINVGGTGFGNHTSIQDAVDNASSGDVIYVYSGVYYETINISQDGITLQGESKENTIIDGTGTAIDNSTVLIDNHSIVIKNFIISNSNKHGIYAQLANNIEISNCEIYDNNDDGIHLIGTTTGNINNCSIYDNYARGILIDSSDNIFITNSIIKYNDYGIKLDDHTNNITITNCNITDNDNIGLLINSFCIDNVIYLNNFIWNYKNSESNDINTWDNGVLGNYWDDYNGDDDDSDGIGDTAYLKNGVDDNYPLVHKYESVINQDTGKIFITIQAAVDDTGTKIGHTIFVKEDTYYENIVVSKDDITIQGENKDTTIIDASNQKMNGILIKNHNNVTIKSFTIRNSPETDIYKSNGIFIWAYAPLSGNNNSNHNAITDCIINSNGNYGVLIYGQNFGQSTNSNIISNCEIFDNGHSGIRITNDEEDYGYSTADGNQIINCELYDNGYYGDQDYSEAAISISPEGEVTNTLIKDCIIYYSYGYDIHITTGLSVEKNVIYHNNFLTDYDNTYDEGNNIWNDSIEGNYWACYDDPSEGAYDTDDDGVIDDPYNISGGDNQDLFPLAEPMGLFLPVAEANGPYTAFVGDTITFDATGSFDPDGTIYVYEWDLGNGNKKYGKTLTYAYPAAGKYIVTLTVEDEYGLTDSDTTTATITEEEEDQNETENKLPVAKAGGPYYEFVGVPILFDGSDSYDLDGTSIKFKWNFGDGKTSTSKMPTHSYSKEGNYTVKLTVTDEDGASDIDTTFALITKKPNNPPGQPFVNGTITGHINITFNYTANASDPDDDMIQYIFNWSDGTNETISPLLNSSEQFNTSHNWSVGGIYVIMVYTRDENNATSDVQPFKVLIDTHKCGALGYLLDKDGDGIFDVFYREGTGKETICEKNGSEYNIDINNDGKWDYIYNFTTNKIIKYQSAVVGNKNSFTIEMKWLLLILVIVAFVILLLVKNAIHNGQKAGKKPVKKEEKKSEKTKIESETKIHRNDDSYASSPNNKKIEDIEKDVDQIISKK